jgi:hypothetical protein
VSKRNVRRFAALGGVALALGAMAPAMALRIDSGAVAGAGAGLELNTDDILPAGDLDVQHIIDFGRDSLVFTNTLALADAGFLTRALNLNVISPTLGGLADVVDAANLEGVLPECSLVAVASCNQGGNGGDVNVLSNILSNNGDLNVLSNNGDDALGVNVIAPVIAPVIARVGGILGGPGGLGFLGSILNVDAGAGVGVGAVVGLLGSL